jgi:hypothetical protein
MQVGIAWHSTPKHCTTLFFYNCEHVRGSQAKICLYPCIPIPEKMLQRKPHQVNKKQLMQPLPYACPDKTKLDAWTSEEQNHSQRSARKCWVHRSFPHKWLRAPVETQGICTFRRLTLRNLFRFAAVLLLSLVPEKHPSNTSIVGFDDFRRVLNLGWTCAVWRNLKHDILSPWAYCLRGAYLHHNWNTHVLAKKEPQSSTTTHIQNVVILHPRSWWATQKEQFLRSHPTPWPVSIFAKDISLNHFFHPLDPCPII